MNQFGICRTPWIGDQTDAKPEQESATQKEATYQKEVDPAII